LNTKKGELKDYKKKLSKKSDQNTLSELQTESTKSTLTASDIFYNGPVTVHIILGGSFKKYIDNDVTKATLHTVQFLSSFLGHPPTRFKNLHLSNGSVVISFIFLSSHDISETVESLIALKSIKTLNDTRGNEYKVEKILYWTADSEKAQSPFNSMIRTTTKTAHSTVEKTTEAFVNQSNLEVIKFEFIIEEEFKTALKVGLENYTFNIIDQLKQIMHLPESFFHNFVLKEGSIRVSFELWSITGYNISKFMVQRAAENFFTLLANNRLVIKDTYGKVLKILPVSATISTTNKNNQKVNEDDYNYDKASSFDVVVILSICMGVGFVLILGVFLTNFLMKLYFRRKYKKQIKPQESTVSHSLYEYLACAKFLE